MNIVCTLCDFETGEVIVKKSYRSISVLESLFKSADLDINSLCDGTHYELSINFITKPVTKQLGLF